MDVDKTCKVQIYSTEFCPYCTAARMLLKKKGVDYTDLLVTQNPELRAEMERKSGRTSVPQIFINDNHIGGFDDLYLLDQKGKLDPLLDGCRQENSMT